MSDPERDRAAARIRRPENKRFNLYEAGEGGTAHIFKAVTDEVSLKFRLALLRCHPERRKPFGERFSKSNPTIGRARSGVSVRNGRLVQPKRYGRRNASPTVDHVDFRQSGNPPPLFTLHFSLFTFPLPLSPLRGALPEGEPWFGLNRSPTQPSAVHLSGKI